MRLGFLDLHFLIVFVVGSGFLVFLPAALGVLRWGVFIGFTLGGFTGL